ncbi:MAG: hypothetical protein EBZ61_01415 [Micrococcales bacterium]|nr:hypothetical protein [Micrococcales bacterium]
MKLKLNPNEIGLLTSLAGSTFRYVVGASLQHELTAAEIYLVTETDAISIRATTEEYKFDGEYEDFNRLGISKASKSKVQRVIEEGELLRKHNGERILAVFLLQDRINGYLDGNPNFSLESDCGIIFQLESGFIGVYQSDRNLPILEVSYSDTISLETSPRIESIFEDDINQKFDYFREVKKIG